MAGEGLGSRGGGRVGDVGDMKTLETCEYKQQGRLFREKG